jgi:hypothetical protein
VSHYAFLYDGFKLKFRLVLLFHTFVRHILLTSEPLALLLLLLLLLPYSKLVSQEITYSCIRRNDFNRNNGNQSELENKLSYDVRTVAYWKNVLSTSCFAT